MARTWFITGASRGLGLETARAALIAGDQVVATARQVGHIRQELAGHGDRLLAAALDVTDYASVQAAVQAAMRQFGRIDVLVNNAGYGQFGAFEELSVRAINRQFETNVFGTFRVTRAILPIMRAQRAGHIMTISSIAGISGWDGSSIYCASKFALAGWSESLSLELARFNIQATSVHPGFFRTDFLDQSSARYGDIEMDDYRESSAQLNRRRAERNHKQEGNPERFGVAMVQLSRLKKPPVRFGAGTDSVEAMLGRAESLLTATLEWRALSEATDFT
ncbi:MAG TPA: SDR family oxidoreductase [Bordetella sp.]